MKIFHRLPKGTKYKDFSTKELCMFVLKNYKALVEACKKDLFMFVKDKDEGKKEVTLETCVSPTTESNQDTKLAHDPAKDKVKKESPVEVTCCEASIKKRKRQDAQKWPC